MDCTDRHYRYMMRFLTRKTLLYTEMVTTGALLFGDKKRHLDFSPEELPLSLQLGGDDPHDMAQCAKLGQDWGDTPKLTSTSVALAIAFKMGNSELA